MTELLKVENVSAGYDGKKVIRDISFSISAGEFLSLIGPNGAGKTTLFRTISARIYPESGQVLWQGQDLFKMNPLLRAEKIAVLPQFLPLPRGYNVQEFISLGRFPYQKWGELSSSDQEVIQRVIHLLQLENLKNKYLFEISGGELQKILIAQTLVQEPELLLLDEPTSHLDIGHQIEIMDLLKRLNREGLTIIAVLHDLNLASEYCDRLILLNEGKVVKDGSPWEVMDYRIIEKVYNVTVVIKENPYSRRPFLILYTGKEV